MSRLAHQIAVESARVRGDIYEVTEFPDVARRYRVTSVPKTLVEERIELLGVRSAPDLLEAMGLSADPQVDV